jgi:polar amino acid transport system substrate-binding protein
MKKGLKRTAVLAISICIALVSVSGCGSKAKTLADYKKAGKIVMGTNAQFPPFEYYEKEQITGFDVELSQKVADKLGVKLDVQDMNFNGLLTALSSQKIDFVAAGMTVNDERKKSVDFSDGYYESSQVIIVMKDNTAIKGKADLANKKIGVQIGTTGADEAKKIEGATATEYNAGFAAIMDMKNGKLDAVVLDYEPSKNFVAQNADIKLLSEYLTKEDYAIAVRKGETELQAAINGVIKDMKSNGEYDALIKKYFAK